MFGPLYLLLVLPFPCLSFLLQAPKASTENEYMNKTLLEIRLVEKDIVRVNITDARFTIYPLQLTVDEPSVAVVLNKTLYRSDHFYIEGLFVGRTTLRLQGRDGFTANYTLAVLRNAGPAQTVFAVIVSLLSVSTSFMMGTQIDWRIIVATLKRPIAPIIGFLCQFGIMPLIALGWGRVLLPGKEFLQLGYFAVGCCPGGKMSNLWSILLDANLDLSVTLTACSSILALGMMPMWLLTIVPNVISQETDVHIPYEDLLGGLALFVVPTVCGVLLRHFRPAAADAIGSKVKIVSLVTIAIIIIAAIAINWYIFLLFTWRAVLAGLLLPWTGFALAYAAAWLLRQSARDVRTIAIETGIQNASIATIIILFSLPQPDADLTLVMPVVCMIFTPLPLAVAAAVITAVRKYKERRTPQVDNSKHRISVTYSATPVRGEVLVRTEKSAKTAGHSANRLSERQRKEKETLKRQTSV